LGNQSNAVVYNWLNMHCLHDWQIFQQFKTRKYTSWPQSIPIGHKHLGVLV
jgi:hypothetical protein